MYVNFFIIGDKETITYSLFSTLVQPTTSILYRSGNSSCYTTFYILIDNSYDLEIAHKKNIYIRFNVLIVNIDNYHLILGNTYFKQNKLFYLNFAPLPFTIFSSIK